MTLRRYAAVAGLLACAARPSQLRPVPRVDHVSIRGFAFTPATIEVAVGDTVVWTNDDQFAHTTSADSSAWSSPELRFGERFTWVASTPGRFYYHCAAHPVMRGILVVRR
jgi:plastocyanin